MPLLALLRVGLRLPAAASKRALGSLSRLAHLVPVQRDLATSLLDESHTSAALSPEDLRDLLAP